MPSSFSRRRVDHSYEFEYGKLDYRWSEQPRAGGRRRYFRELRTAVLRTVVGLATGRE